MTTEIDKIEDQPELTTSNVEENQTSTPAVETKQEEPKSISLDDALAKAFEKHSAKPEQEEKPKTAFPKATEVAATEEPEAPSA